MKNGYNKAIGIIGIVLILISAIMIYKQISGVEQVSVKSTMQSLSEYNFTSVRLFGSTQQIPTTTNNETLDKMFKVFHLLYDRSISSKIDKVGVYLIDGVWQIIQFADWTIQTIFK